MQILICGIIKDIRSLNTSLFWGMHNSKLTCDSEVKGGLSLAFGLTCRYSSSVIWLSFRSTQAKSQILKKEIEG